MKFGGLAHREQPLAALPVLDSLAGSTDEEVERHAQGLGEIVGDDVVLAEDGPTYRRRSCRRGRRRA